MENENRPPKKPFLKKGTGKARILQRNVIINPPSPADLLSSSDKTQTSSQSLPLIANLSPITKEPAINIRPKTAETGDSGVRDINLQVSPTYDSVSIRTIVTTYEKESPPKVPIETESNGADEAKQNEDEKNLHVLQQSYSTSVKQLEGLNLQHGASTSSRTVSYTSLNHIQTPPIQNQAEENEFDDSDYSAEIYAASRSTESASVGTSHVSHEPKNNDSQESEHGNFSAITKFPASALRSVVDPNLYLYGTSYRENQSLSPAYTGQFDNIISPLNAKNQSPFFKGRSKSPLQYTQPIPLSYLSQTAQRLGIIPEIKYILPPHPKALESPDVANEFRTPKSKKYISFFNTPLLPKTSVNNEERKVLESLAEQLRALLILIDVTLDGKNDRMNQLKYIYSEKAKALEKKEKEMKEKMIAEEKKLMGAKAKLKLEIDKMKQTDGILKKLESELKQVKTKYVDTSRILSNYRTTKNLMEEKLKKAEEELQKEKEKAMKWELLNSRLKNELDLERMKKHLMAKHQSAQATVPLQQTRQPLRQFQSKQQRSKQFENPLLSQNIQEANFPELLQQQNIAQKDFTNTSSSSFDSLTKDVNWNLNEDSENNQFSPFFDNLNFTSLKNYIPLNSQLIHKVDDQSFTEEQYRRFGFYRLIKECKCEIIKYDNNDLRYCYLTDVKVNITYIEENGQLTVSLPGGYIVNTFPSTQLEIHRTSTNEISVVDSNGTRFEYFNVLNEEKQAIEMFDKNGGQKQNPDGSFVKLEDINTKRAENDKVEQNDSTILFCCPGFFVTRSLDKDFGGGVTIRVNSNEPNKAWKITVCPEHRVFYVKHYNGNQEQRCFYTDRRCDHLKN